MNYPTITQILAHLNDPYTDFLTPQEYEYFNNNLKLRYTGIGIYIDVVEKGFRVADLISGSPAEKSGLQVGDIITALEGRSIEGLSLQEVLPLMKGQEGSSLHLNYLREGKPFTVEVDCVNLTIPSVSSGIKPFNTGYLNIISFNNDTGVLFAASLDNLRLQNPSSYIVDLRNNGGGYLQSALDIAGYFIGDKSAMQVYYRNSSPYGIRGIKHSYIVDKPTIILINNNTASASEILTMAVKDNNNAVLIGTKTYGKGCGQQIFPLGNGDYFKMTTTYFTSPLAKSINKTGITPDLLIEKANPLKVALLLRSANDSTINKNGLVKLVLAPQSLVIDSKQARNPEYWQAYGEILDRAGLVMMQGHDNEWEGITQQELMDRRSLYYSDYLPGNQVPGVISDNKLTIHFARTIDWNSINQDHVELIDSNTGTRVPLAFTRSSDTDICAALQNNLLQDTTYWLVLHPGIQYTDGSSLQTGVTFSTIGKSTEEQADSFTLSWIPDISR